MKSSEVDLVIRGGTVVDGTGADGVVADVAVSNGRIVVLGRFEGRAKHTIDATGMTVAPGFIDPHTHLDPQLFWDPYGLPIVLHGVTTVMTGNCGVSLAPCGDDAAVTVARLFYQVEEVPVETLSQGLPWTWGGFDKYLAALDGRLGINCAPLVGHCAIRQYVMGADCMTREATQGEIELMREVLRACLHAGAFGFSSSQSKFHVADGGRPIPSRIASQDEIERLCDVLGEEGRGIIQLDGGVEYATRAEWIRDFVGPLAERTGRPVLAGTVFVSPFFPNKWKEILASLETLHDAGLNVYAHANPVKLDVYFTLDNAVHFNEFATWLRVSQLPVEERRRSYVDEAIRAAIQKEFDEVEGGRMWDKIEVYKVNNPALEHLQGASLESLAESRGIRIIDAILDVALQDDLGTQFVELGVMNNDPVAVRELLTSDVTIVGASDAGAHVKSFCGFGDTSLLLGTWVRDTGAMTLPQAIRRLTWDQARVLGITDRGRIAEGMAADLVVFDASTVTWNVPRLVRDLPAGAERLWRDATGVSHVVVNGSLVVDDGEITGDLPGHLVPAGS